jgi:DNA replication protein DnaC
MISPQDRAARRTAMSQYCRQLVLTQTAVALCETATPRQEEFLLTVLRAEIAQREANRRARLVARAGFPAYKTLTGLDRQGITLPSALTWADLEQGTFITDHRNLVLYGGVGTGKTHTALALGYAACERGLTVRFFTVTELVMRLSAAKRVGTADRLLQELHRADLIILDEWGDCPRRPRGSATAVPGHCGQLRNAQSRDHDEPRIFSMGDRVR